MTENADTPDVGAPRSRPVWTVEVIGVERASRHMTRVTFGGPDPGLEEHPCQIVR
jgi:NADPH-dependent ferric siderophore reductase